jgi:hypothetical protein
VLLRSSGLSVNESWGIFRQSVLCASENLSRSQGLWLRKLVPDFTFMSESQLLVEIRSCEKYGRDEEGIHIGART